MKKIISCFCLLLCSFVNAEDYQKKIDSYNYLVNNFTVPKTYGFLKFKSKNKLLKLEEMSDFNQKMVFLIGAEKLSSKLESLKLELQSRKDEDSEKYLKKLDVIHLRFIKNWEKLALTIFDDYSEKFTIIEKEHYLSTIK